jgi:murein hydrolase activator
VNRVLALVLLAGVAHAGPGGRAKALLSEEADILEGLDALDREIAGVAVSQADKQAARALAAAQVEAVEAQLNRAQVVLDARREALRRRLRARGGRHGATMRVLLSSADLNAMLRRRVYLQRVLRHDLSLLRARRGDALLLEQLEKDRAAKAEALQLAESDLEQERARLEAERQVKAEVLAALRQERRLLKRVRGAQRVARGAVDKRLAAEDARPVTGFAAKKGSLPWPVGGRLIHGYGKQIDPEHGTETFSKGWALDAPLGTHVRAVAEGAVVYSGWYKGFGNLIIVDHGGRWFTLYAHLSGISKARGEQVKGGDVVGSLGDTGSLRGPQLYFELREGSRPVNPARWLRR